MSLFLHNAQAAVLLLLLLLLSPIANAQGLAAAGL